MNKIARKSIFNKYMYSLIFFKLSKTREQVLLPTKGVSIELMYFKKKSYDQSAGFSRAKRLFLSRMKYVLNIVIVMRAAYKGDKINPKYPITCY